MQLLFASLILQRLLEKYDHEFFTQNSCFGVLHDSSYKYQKFQIFFRTGSAYSCFYWVRILLRLKKHMRIFRQ